MRRLGKHMTYEFQTHVELDAPSVMCSCYKQGRIREEGMQQSTSKN